MQLLKITWIITTLVGSLALPAFSDAATGVVSFTVSLPGNADLVINGRPTTQRGSIRAFFDSDVLPGLRYRYELNASIATRNGTRKKNAILRLFAGDTATVEFEFTTPSIVPHFHPNVIRHCPSNWPRLYYGVPPQYPAVVEDVQANGTLQIDEIRIARIRGVNAELLRQATQAALSSVNLTTATSASSRDEVSITTQRHQFGEIFYTLSVTARIQSSANQIYLTVRVVDAKAASGRPGPIDSGDLNRFADAIYDRVKAALMQGSISN